MLKRTADVLDYTADFTLWLAAGDLIGSAVFEVPTLSGLVIDSEANTPTTATVWLSSGNPGTWQVNCAIMTMGGRTKNQPLQIDIPR